MIKTVLLLTALALVQARPDAEQVNSSRRYEFHPDCPPAEVHFLLPHEYDCTKFYYCEYGLKWIEPRNCAPGTEFNAEIQVCVHPASSGCHLPGYSTTEGQTAAPTTAAPITAAPTTAAPTTAAPTTAAPSTAAPTTAAPATVAPTTAAPATVAPTTAAPATVAPSTAAPTTAAPATVAPTTAAPATVAPTTAAPATVAPTTAAPDDCETLDNGCPADFNVHKLIPHEEYCHKFYYCDKGELVPRYCPEGTYFNPKYEICDWPFNVDCVNDGAYSYPTTAAPAPTTPGGNDIGDVLDNGCPADFSIHHLLPHETECNKFYYCNFGNKVERTCAPGTYFNFEIQVCDWPANVDCVSSGNPTTVAPVPDSSEEISNPADPQDPQDPWVPLPNGCPSNFDVHHLLPHESDCGKFYYCVHGQTVEASCAPGLHFSPWTQTCDWPQNAGCEHWDNGGCPTPNPDGGCTSTAAPVTEGQSTAAPLTSTNTPITVTQGTSSSAPVTPTIPATQGTSTVAPIPDSSEEISNPADPQDPQDPWVPLPNGCPSNFDVHHLLPHESDCGKFYYCVNGELVEASCAPGLHFSPWTQTCDWPQNAGCEQWDNGGCPTPSPDGGCTSTAAPVTEGTSPVTQPITVTQGTTTVAPVNPTTLPTTVVTQGTSSFAPVTPTIPATQGTSTVAPIPDSSEEISNPADPQDPQDPWLPNGCPSDFDVHHLLPHESDCGKFYYCVYGELVEASCPAGLHFSPWTQTCDWPLYASCEHWDGSSSTAAPVTEGTSTWPVTVTQGTTTVAPVNPTTLPTTVTQAPTTVAPEIPTTSAPEGTTPDDGCDGTCPINPADKCRNECNIAPWAHDDCDKFWICNGDQAILITCSEGLHYNPNTYSCDFNCNVGCVRNSVQATPLYDGVQVFLPWNQIDENMMKVLKIEL